jgi:hypothetical protein
MLENTISRPIRRHNAESNSDAMLGKQQNKKAGAFTSSTTSYSASMDKMAQRSNFPYITSVYLCWASIVKSVTRRMGNRLNSHRAVRCRGAATIKHKFTTIKTHQVYFECGGRSEHRVMHEMCEMELAYSSVRRLRELHCCGRAPVSKLLNSHLQPIKIGAKFKFSSPFYKS